MACAKSSTKYIARSAKAASTFQRFNDSILLAFVSFRDDPIFDAPNVNHAGNEIEKEKSRTETGRGDSRDKNKNPSGNRTEHPQETGELVSLIYMTKSGNDAQDYRDRVARFAFGRLRFLTGPIALVEIGRASCRERVLTDV